MPSTPSVPHRCPIQSHQARPSDDRARHTSGALHDRSSRPPRSPQPGLPHGKTPFPSDFNEKGTLFTQNSSGTSTVPPEYDHHRRSLHCVPRLLSANQNAPFYPAANQLLRLKKEKEKPHRSTPPPSSPEYTSIPSKNATDEMSTVGFEPTYDQQQRGAPTTDLATLR